MRSLHLNPMFVQNLPVKPAVDCHTLVCHVELCQRQQKLYQCFTLPWRCVGQAPNADLSQFTPSFLWLLRDFYLQLEEGGRQISPREYLETALSSVSGTSAGAKAKNGIRESIKSLFPDRDCFTLVRPMSDENKLAHLEDVPSSQLRPEFRDGLAKLVDTCFARAQPKRIGRHVLTGPMLAGLVTAYVDAINRGAVPTIATAWQGVAESECRRAADEAERVYREAFNADVSADESALQAEHNRAMGVAKAHYDRVRILCPHCCFAFAHAAVSVLALSRHDH